MRDQEVTWFTSSPEMAARRLCLFLFCAAADERQNTTGSVSNPIFATDVIPDDKPVCFRRRFGAGPSPGTAEFDSYE